MKVYGVYEDYYGDIFLMTPIYKNQDDAISSAKSEVAKKQGEVDKMRKFVKKSTPDEPDEYQDYVEVTANEWRGGYCNDTAIIVREIDLI